MALTAIRALAPHDLVLVDPVGLEDLVPAWADRVDGGVWGVVRRSLVADGIIPLGLRGRERHERQAIDVRVDAVRSTRTPESLVGLATVPVHAGIAAALAAIGRLAPALIGSRAWGPTGSVGFELATGIAVVRPSSDLDLIVRAPARIGRVAAAGIAAAFDGLPVRVDCLIETPSGAVALREWADRRTGEVVLRTARGPVLTSDPWAPLPAP